MPLQYHPLDETVNEIRLLQLSPSNSISSPFSCDIICTSQHEAPPYSALSYVWGSPTSTHPITIHQSHVTCGLDASLDALRIDASESCETVQVTRNLEAALRHLVASLDGEMFLWVDALCIDQSNNGEKASQVARMTEIFRRAERVFVWLGDAEEGSDEVVEVLEEIGEEAAKLEAEEGVYQLLRKSREPVERSSGDEEKEEVLKRFLERLAGRVKEKRTFPPDATNAFINRPWWTRIWVIQEACVATTLVFVCGVKRLQGKHCFLALEALAGYWQKIEKSTLRGPHIATPYERELMKLYTTQLVIWRRLGKYNFLEEESRPSLFDLLQWCTSQPGLARMHATDPRDRIFSLLGIAHETLDIKPNYDMSCEEVYAHTSKALLGSGHFGILYLGQPHRNMLELPSWVVDWSAEFGRTSLRLSKISNACGDTTPSINFESSRFGLPTAAIVTGIQIDRIAGVGPTWKECRSKMGRRQKHSQAISRLWCQMFKATAISSDILSRGKASDIDESIFRCSKYDYDDEGAMFGLTSDELFEGYKELMKITSGFHHDQRQNIISFSYVVKRNSEARRCFVTENGYVGLGLESIEEGDLVVIFYGARIPFVIRERADMDFTLVGGAYIDGIMSGEAIKEGQEIRDFKIR